MYAGKLVCAQIMEHLPLHTFRRIVARYAGERKVPSFSCLDQFLCMAFVDILGSGMTIDLLRPRRKDRTHFAARGGPFTFRRNGGMEKGSGCVGAKPEESRE
jgi:hypothetical protein